MNGPIDVLFSPPARYYLFKIKEVQGKNKMELQYRIIGKQGNGYRCSCCRHTHQTEDNFNTIEEVYAFLAEKEAVKKIKEAEKEYKKYGLIYEDEDDWDLIEIIKFQEYKEEIPDLTELINKKMDIRLEKKRGIVEAEVSKKKKELRSKIKAKIKKLENLKEGGIEKTIFDLKKELNSI